MEEEEGQPPAAVHHRPVDCDRHELSPPAETGGYRVLAVIFGFKTVVNVVKEDKRG